MSALGHEQTSRHVRVMSVNPLKAKPSTARVACPLSAINGHWGFSRSALFCTARWTCCAARL